MPRRTLYTDVHERAEPVFVRSYGKITAENIDEYSSFYVAAARQIKAEFEAEGLAQTAAKMQEIITFTERSMELTKKAKEKATLPLEEVIKIMEAPPQPRPLDEDILPDNYPMYADFTYVVDGVVTLNHLHGISVYGYKVKTGAAEVRRCDIYGRLERKRNGKAD